MFANLPNLCSLDSVSGRGAFTEYAKAFSDIVWKVPQGALSFEQAAATGSPYVILVNVLSSKVLI